MSESTATYEARLSESDNAFLEMMNERLAELELALENQDWLRLSGDNDREFSREGLRRICALARLAYLKNPLINRAVSVGTHYVWAQGVTVAAADEAVNAVVQAFLDDDGNKAELFGRQARNLKETDLQVYGNVFLALFADPNTGQVRVRSLPVDEVHEIVTAPDDRREVRYYRRHYTDAGRDTVTGQQRSEQKTVYYPDWRYRPPVGYPARIGSDPVEQNAVVYHIRVGGLSDMLWGVPEVYSALDWAQAYKSFLEDWATIVRAYSRFAWNVTTKGGARAVSAAKAKLNTTFGTGGSGVETNPPPGTGSVFIGSEGAKIDPVRTAGATTSAEDGRFLRLMVAAGVGLPETFFGDADVGNHATAKTLDRPTEMRISERQGLWSDVIVDLCQYAIDWAAVAPMGALAKSGITPRYVQPKTVTGKLVQDTTDRTVTAEFPDILEQDVNMRVDAVVKATTLAGQKAAGTIDLVLATRLALIALGVEDIDATMGRLFPDGVEDLVWQREELASAPVPAQLQQPQATNTNGEKPMPTAEALMLEAVRELRVMSERGGV